jgi:hypothetical protein
VIEMNLSKILIIAVFSLSVIGLVSASLLTYFGKITTTAEVEQAVTLLGASEHTIPEAAPGGESFCFLQKIRNDASIDVPLEFVTDCGKDGMEDDCGGITSTVHEVPDMRVLELDNKDSEWTRINDGISGTLSFDPVKPTFDYELSVSGMQPSTGYALIYYADYDPRFDNWGGDNPGKVIATFVTDEFGDYSSGEQSVELGINMPTGDDWNIAPVPNYCDYHNGIDDYLHCKGAKIWVVPVSDLTDGTSLPLVAWNPSEYLFETDLVVYSDCDMEPMGFAVDMEIQVPITGITVDTKSTTPILTCYAFDVAIAPGSYVITTDVVPAED